MVDHAVRRPLSRRAFLKAGAATSGALVLGVYLPEHQAGAAPAGASSFTPNAFVRIDVQGRVTLVMPMVEMGQGIYTAQAMLLLTLVTPTAPLRFQLHPPARASAIDWRPREQARFPGWSFT
jgi:CO/xanthine dehydrogenase Mo-binding subunit